MNAWCWPEHSGPWATHCESMSRQLVRMEDFDFQLAPHLVPFVPLLGDEILGMLEAMPHHLAHQLAVDLRGYLWFMRRSWGWHFTVLFELHLYALSLERTLKDYHRLHPPPSPGDTPFPQLTAEDRSFLDFLFLDLQGRYDATCESISWHFLRMHIPAFAILLAPAESNRICE